MTYGATAEECTAWADRPSHSPDRARLVPLTLENNRGYYALRTHHSQERFVAPMSWSYADALFPEVIDGAPVVPRLYGVEADGKPVAFVMIAEVTPAHPSCTCGGCWSTGITSAVAWAEVLSTCCATSSVPRGARP